MIVNYGSLFLFLSLLCCNQVNSLDPFSNRWFSPVENVCIWALLPFTSTHDLETKMKSNLILKYVNPNCHSQIFNAST